MSFWQNALDFQLDQNWSQHSWQLVIGHKKHFFWPITNGPCGLSWFLMIDNRTFYRIWVILKQKSQLLITHLSSFLHALFKKPGTTPNLPYLNVCNYLNIISPAFYVINHLCNAKAMQIKLASKNKQCELVGYTLRGWDLRWWFFTKPKQRPAKQTG